MIKRLFIAVPVPDYVRFELEEATRMLEEPLRGKARLAPSEDWHFTLVFLGDTDERDIPKIKDAMRNVTKPPLNNSIELFSGAELEIEWLAFGPSEKNPRMIWFLGNERTSRALGEIAKKIKHELASRGVRFSDDHAQFKAHITYARFREGGRPAVKLPKLKPVSFPLEEILLMESHLSDSGAEYNEIFKIRL